MFLIRIYYIQRVDMEKDNISIWGVDMDMQRKFHLDRAEATRVAKKLQEQKTKGVKPIKIK